jgi:hypothetical protein
MNVLIVNNMVPFIREAAEELAVHLQENIIIAGHEAEILRIPFQREPVTRIPSQMLMVRAFELWNVDHVIALAFPAYLIRHPKKTLWLLDQHRQTCHLFDMGQAILPPGGEDSELPTLIRNACTQSLAESRHVFTTSQATRQRLLEDCGCNASVLLPPANGPESWPQTIGKLLG